MAKSKKNNDKIVKIDTSFDELVAMSVQGNPKPKPKKETKKKSN